MSMTRRVGSRISSVERPRQKGWWGVPEADIVEELIEPSEPPSREAPRRISHPRQTHTVTQVGRALTPSQVEAIRTVMHLFVDDDTARGVDPHSTILCHRCQANRRAIGAIRYDRLVFCNDCSIEYEIAHGRRLIESPSEFCERSAMRAASA
jgi:hypothetical protein